MAVAPANIRPNPSGDMPRVDAAAYVDPSAQVIGNVSLGAGVFVGPCAVIRADEPDASGKVHPVVIGNDCNIQDGVIVHAPAGYSVTIEPGCSLAHGCVVHGPTTIGANCFLGIRSVVIGSKLETGVWVGVGATILEIKIPSYTFVPGRLIVNSRDKVSSLSPVKDFQQEFQSLQVRTNVAMAQAYKAMAPDQDSD